MKNRAIDFTKQKFYSDLRKFTKINIDKEWRLIIIC